MTKLRIMAALLAFLVYIAIPTKNYYWDGVSFAQTIETAQHLSLLFHPNHLLYNLVGWIVYKLLDAGMRALYVLQALNAVFAALTVFVLSGIIGRLTRSTPVTLLLSAAFAFSGTWWRFSTDADAYILSILLLTLCAYILLFSEQPRPLKVAGFHAAAMLIHQLAFIFMPAALFLLWRKPSTTPRKRASACLLYLAVAGAATGAVYLIAFNLQTGSRDLHAFALWTASHAGDVTFSFQLIRNIGISLRSWLQLFVVGRPSIVHYTNPLTIVLLAMMVAALVLLIAGIMRFRKRPIAVQQQAAFRFALIWMAAYAVFLLFWLPNNTFYKLFALPAVIIAIAACWKPGATLNPRSPAILGVALMAIFNLTFAIIPYSRESANPAVEFALRLRTQLNGDATVYFDSFNTDDWFARYFAPSTNWKHVEAPAVIDADVRNGKTVWLETTAIDAFSKSDPAWLNHRLQNASWRELVNTKHRIRFARLR